MQSRSGQGSLQPLYSQHFYQQRNGAILLFMFGQGAHNFEQPSVVGEPCGALIREISEKMFVRRPTHKA